MITPIKCDMEAYFHTIDSEYVSMEIGFHKYPDPLYTGVIGKVILDVSSGMLCQLHNSIRDQAYNVLMMKYGSLK